jgi:hybrid cluster-associated redox disulfide protein
MKNKKIRTKNSNSKTKTLVTKKMSFSELMQKYPQAVEVLMNEGMHCIGCAASAFETIEQGAIMHGLNPNKLVEKINKKLSKKKK